VQAAPNCSGACAAKYAADPWAHETRPVLAAVDIEVAPRRRIFEDRLPELIGQSACAIQSTCPLAPEGEAL
jgi:hypothetical protein